MNAPRKYSCWILSGSNGFAKGNIYSWKDRMLFGCESVTIEKREKKERYEMLLCRVMMSRTSPVWSCFLSCEVRWTDRGKCTNPHAQSRFQKCWRSLHSFRCPQQQAPIYPSLSDLERTKTINPKLKCCTWPSLPSSVSTLILLGVPTPICSGFSCRYWICCSILKCFAKSLATLAALSNSPFKALHWNK